MWFGVQMGSKSQAFNRAHDPASFGSGCTRYRELTAHSRDSRDSKLDLESGRGRTLGSSDLSRSRFIDVHLFDSKAALWRSASPALRAAFSESLELTKAKSADAAKACAEFYCKKAEAEYRSTRKSILNVFARSRGFSSDQFSYRAV